VSVRILLALHLHQPIGNFDHVFEEAVERCYAPLLLEFERHPGVRAACHLSGCLLEWLEGHDRRFLDRVTARIASGQIEPLGGGFYEPILPVLPRADALDQIALLQEYWTRRAGVRPRGAWIAERVWEPALAEILAEAGILYTILDDQHLRFAGILDERPSGAFVTERAGRGVVFFPSDFALRYLIPFRPIGVLREHLEGLPAGRDWVLTYGDDAEKFGLWPETWKWMQDQAWLPSFFDLLEEGRAARAEAPGRFLDERPALRKVYVPNASYTEMLEWALPAAAAVEYARTRAAARAGSDPEAVRAFVRGPLWDMFLARYPEADQLHKHVLWSSRRVRALPPSTPGRDEALRSVLRAQCNCAYWHGLFGGLYFPHLRHGVFRSLLDADAFLASTEPDGVVAVAEDLDGDMENEVILRCPRAQAFFRPSDGGALVELDFLPSRFNVTNVVSRWREAYHLGADQTHAPAAVGAVRSPHETAVRLGPEEVASRPFDERPLRSLRDFGAGAFPAAAGLPRFDGMELLEGRLAGWSLLPDGFRAACRLGGVEYERTARMERDGALEVVWRPGGAPRADRWLGTVLCLTLLTGDAPGRAVLAVDPAGLVRRSAPGETRDAAEVARLTLEDRAFGFALDLLAEPAARLAMAPIETLQRSEDRVGPVYQGTLFALGWRIGGAAVAPVRLRFHWRTLS
jgi:alpha-amylase